MKPRARCAGFSVAEIGNRKERLRDYASFPDDFDLSPLNPLRPPHPLKRAGTPCTRVRGNVPDYCPAGHDRGMGLRGSSPEGGNSFRFAALSTSLKEGGNERF